MTLGRIRHAAYHGADEVSRAIMAGDSKYEKSREQRLAEQLRANLARRKEQVRARRQGEADLRREGVAVESGQGEQPED